MFVYLGVRWAVSMRTETRQHNSAIDVDNVTFTYPPLVPGAESAALLRDLRVQVKAGESWAVMGASGSGKSTLCYLLAGLAPRHTGGRVQGAISVASHDVLAHSPPTGVVGVLFQDAATQLFNTLVEDEVAWGLEALGVPPNEIGSRVYDALARFGLSGLERRATWMLSGGQQKRLALAAVWAMRPRVLVLDEPLGGLDPQGRADVLRTVHTLSPDGERAQDRSPMTLLITSLRPQAVNLVDAAVLLADGECTAPTSPGKLLAQEAQLTRAGILYPVHQWPSIKGRGLTRVSEDGSPSVALRGVSFGYPGHALVLHDLDLTVPQGQFVALVGPNGAGKTTLIRHLNGLLRPTEGRVSVLGRDVGRRPTGDLARDVGFLFQRPEQQIFGATVREEVGYGLRRLGLPDIEPRVTQALAWFELLDVADVPPAILSYGQQRAVTLAVLAALDPPILVLDEPTVGLDGAGWARLLDWLRERREAGVTLIVVTHELDLAAQAERVIAMRKGRVVADGAPESVLSEYAL